MANTVLTEIFVNFAWTDVSHSVRNNSAVRITQGQPNESGGAQPVTMTIVFNNGAGNFSPDNPLGLYWGTFGRGTRIRVTNNNSVRFRGQIVSATVTWDTSGKDIITTCICGGPLRQLGQGTPPALSPARRFIRSLPGADGVLTNGGLDVLAWFPLEDPTGTAYGSAHAIGAGANITNSLDNLTSGSGPATAAYGDTTGNPPGAPVTMRMVQGGKAVAKFDSLPITVAGAWSVSFFAKMDVGTSYIMFVHPGNMNIGPNFPSGVDPTLYAKLILDLDGTVSLYYNDSGAAGPVQVGAVITVDPDNGTILNHAGFGGWPLQKWHHYLISFVSGGSLGTYLWIDGVLQVSTTAASTPFTAPDTVTVTSSIGAPAADPHTINIGHLMVRAGSPFNWPTGTLVGLANANLGNVGELAAVRVARLCAEEGITSTITGTLSAPMGPQAVDNVLNLLRACQTVDMGLLYDSRTANGINYITRASLYNATVAVTADYTANHLSPPFTPIIDDAQTKNDVTVTRLASSISARIVQKTGPVGTNTVGTYAAGITANTQTDNGSASVAGWLVALGTVAQTRYPKLTFELARAIVITAGIVAALQTVDVGSRMQITNPKLLQAPGTIDVLCVGYTEMIDRFLNTLTFVTAPYSPYTVIRVGTAGLMRVDSLNTIITGGPFSAAATSITVKASGTNPDQWVTGAVSFDVTIAGERMTVTNISGSGTQTFTVTRGVNGITKALPDASAVSLTVPYHVGY